MNCLLVFVICIIQPVLSNLAIIPLQLQNLRYGEQQRHFEKMGYQEKENKVLFGYIYKDQGRKYTYQVDQYGQSNVFDISNCRRNLELRHAVRDKQEFNLQFRKFCNNKLSPLFSLKNNVNVNQTIAFKKGDNQTLSIYFQLAFQYTDITKYRADIILNLESITKTLRSRDLINTKRYSFRFKNDTDISLIYGEDQGLEHTRLTANYFITAQSWKIFGQTVIIDSYTSNPKIQITFNVNQPQIMIPQGAFDAFQKSLNNTKCKPRNNKSQIFCSTGIKNLKIPEIIVKNAFIILPLRQLIEEGQNSCIIQVGVNEDTNKVVLGRVVYKEYDILFDISEKQIKMFTKTVQSIPVNQEVQPNSHSVSISIRQYFTVLMCVILGYVLIVSCCLIYRKSQMINQLKGQRQYLSTIQSLKKQQMFKFTKLEEEPNEKVIELQEIRQKPVEEQDDIRIVSTEESHRIASEEHQ